MKLSALGDLLDGSKRFGEDVEIESIAYDSRAVSPGALFVALRGAKSDGHDFVAQAANAGAAALMVEEQNAAWYAGQGLPAVTVPNTRTSMAAVSSAFYGYPSESLDLIGVTGTNGKTTTTYMVESILRTYGEKVGLVGTLGALIKGQPVPLDRTTPESPDLMRLFADMLGQNVRHAVIEVSSEGILQERTLGCAFDTGVFTNLSQDHMNTHKTMEEYFTQKARLFTEYPAQFPRKSFNAVVNADDEYGRRLIEIVRAAGRPVLGFGLKSADAQLKADVTETRPDGSKFDVWYQPPAGSAVTFSVDLKLGGSFQVSNALAAAGAALTRRVPVMAIKNGLEALSSVPGRFEIVPSARHGFTVVVDYAHSPDGLENVLRSARELKPERLICVFGCGGDRDQPKRPLMGRIATDLADVVVVTSDNPRTEEPKSIISMILAGIDQGGSNQKVVIEPDRHVAITWTICKIARPGDLVVIAGKGHETTQQFATHKIPFDDRLVAREALAKCP